MSDRREFLKKTGLLSLVGLTSKLISNDQLNALDHLGNQSLAITPFVLPKLPYAFDGLEPFIDKQTMEIHYTKHHQAYVDKLNKALENYNGDRSWNGLFSQISKLDVAVRNNGGGHYNHSLFWQLMKPNVDSKTNIPTGKLAEIINRDFTSFEAFKTEYSEKATKLFGSGWCWLIVQNGKLKITTTPNQDNPLMDVALDKGRPVLALDVWEHAYYLRYQNKRPDYIANWWSIINWDKAEELYNKV